MEIKAPLNTGLILSGLITMSATGEVEKPTAEQPPAAEKKHQPAIEKIPKAAPKEKKPKAAKTASHLPYFEMIKEALLSLNEKSGSSPYAIPKYMEEKHNSVLHANFRKILGLQLKNSVTKGKFIKIKASYKLSEMGKKDKPKCKATKPATRKASATVKKPKTAKAPAAAAGTKRKATAKKTEGVKKSTPKKANAAKPKQPRSIKSPA